MISVNKAAHASLGILVPRHKTSTAALLERKSGAAGGPRAAGLLIVRSVSVDRRSNLVSQLLRFIQAFNPNVFGYS